MSEQKISCEIRWPLLRAKSFRQWLFLFQNREAFYEIRATDTKETRATDTKAGRSYPTAGAAQELFAGSTGNALENDEARPISEACQAKPKNKRLAAG